MTTINDTTYEYRIARPEDTGAIEAIDGSFSTSTVFEVAVSEDGFALREVPVDPPLVKVFPEDEGGDEEDDAETDGEGGDSRTYVAVGAARAVVGFAAVSYSPADHRGRGIGRALMGHALDEQPAGGPRRGRSRRRARR
ncbi:hypothetical protein GCM10010215_34640 [Streptomyces virginiae]|uniref:GNAT family N-acetyltransferase n=1 Tax=Streptomyces virginiae TaxID=1961 RepID=UPI0017802DFE|nr:GNAT family N-acetyltransferase [Streptomyces virginiae]GGQ06277.1 hypothetical protein GCM10010215_34640 [Streptomyces virginiae]